jgi:hypothetical protein
VKFEPSTTFFVLILSLLVAGKLFKAIENANSKSLDPMEKTSRITMEVFLEGRRYGFLKYRYIQINGLMVRPQES